MTQTETKHKTYRGYAEQWLIDNQIKIKTVYVENGNYNPHFVYLNRIGNCNKPKFRVLEKGKDTVKNCIMVTFNTETVDRKYLSYLIQSKIRAISHLSHGSCHRFINNGILALVISGAVNNNGSFIPSVLNY